MLLDLPTAARYNHWANKRLYKVCGVLSDEGRKRDRHAFFGSIHNTLNHILLADLIYRERLEKKPTSFTRLDLVLHDDFESLRAAHHAQDLWYIEWCETLDPKALDGTLSFDTVETREHFDLPLRRCLTNLFQHQIHHRGQVHDMLSQCGVAPPPLDFVNFAAGG